MAGGAEGHLGAGHGPRPPGKMPPPHSGATGLVAQLGLGANPSPCPHILVTAEALHGPPSNTAKCKWALFSCADPSVNLGGQLIVPTSQRRKDVG